MITNSKLYRTSVAALAVMAALISGCSARGVAVVDDTGPSWDESEYKHYQYVSQRSCECLPESYLPIVVEVLNQEVIRAVYQATGEPVPPRVRDTLKTMDGLFQVIQRATDEGAATVRTTFDPEWGFPTSIRIDWNAQLADDEFQLRVSEFELIVSIACP